MRTNALDFPDLARQSDLLGGRPAAAGVARGRQSQGGRRGSRTGGRIPVHAGGAGHHFLEGAGQMAVGDEVFAVQAGATLLIPDGTSRGLLAQTRLAFIAVRLL